MDLCSKFGMKYLRNMAEVLKFNKFNPFLNDTKWNNYHDDEVQIWPTSPDADDPPLPPAPE